MSTSVLSPRDQNASPDDSGSRHRQVLRTSAIVGGSSLMVAGIGIARTKACALMLGTTGVGLMGIYGSILDLALSIFAMGVASSGVRQVASAGTCEDASRIGRTLKVLRGLSWVLGLVGAGAMLIGAPLVSQFTFGTREHAWPIAMLSVAVLLRIVGMGQGAALQGLRRVPDLARANVYGAALAGVATIALIWQFGQGGIAPSLVFGAAVGLGVSSLFVRKVRIAHADLTATQMREECSAIIGIGLVFMVSSILMMATGYGVRAMLLRQHGPEPAGLYHAAWALGGLYVGFILQAMGADFYPRLVATIRDKDESNRLVNEQIHVGMLLAGPGVAATIVSAPLIVTLFYSAQFAPAAEVLRWLCLGVALRVVNWPSGYVLVAVDHRPLLISVELIWAASLLGLSWWLIGIFGVVGAGIAFFLSYLIHGILVCAVARRLTGLKWSRANLICGVVYALAIGAAFLAQYLPTGAARLTLGLAALVAVSGFSLKQLLKVTNTPAMPARLRRVLARFGMAAKS
jgi:enterobacterial common antigen flippase